MKKTMLTLGLIASFALTATNALANLLAYEPYDYTLATPPGAATGTPTQTTPGGFASAYNGGGGTTAAALTYPSLLTAGNGLNQGANYSGENLASPISSGTVFVSFLCRPGTESNGGNNGGNLVGVEMNTGGNGMFVGVVSPYSASQGTYGVNKQAGYDDNAGNLWSQTAPPSFTYGTTNFIVVELTGTGSGWSGSIWINPPAGTSLPPTPDGTFTVPQFTLSSISIVNPGGGNSFGFDELRAADSWADAVSYTAPIPVNVSITSPVNGATVAPNFSITAAASVAPGNVTNVIFYDGATVLGNVTASPFTYAVTGASGGAHALKAIAEDDSGNFATSSVVNVSVVVPNLVLFPDGDFDHPAGDGSTNYWVQSPVPGAAPNVTFTYPTTGGNANGYAVMDNTYGGNYGVLVAGNTTPLGLSPLGLVAGQTYTFVEDMKIFSGTSIGGLKIESWGPSGFISDSGDMRPVSGTGSWTTYTFSYTIAGGATGIKVVPLWGPNSSVGYDNIGVMVLPVALTASITSPANGATVNTNFTINATALVSPASVTNVYFFVDNGLVGSSSTYPYTYTSGNTALSGAHSLKVVAKANNGSSATSSVVNVTIVAAALPVPPYPITDAPTPKRLASTVISIFNASSTYTNVTVNNWHNAWGDSTTISDYTITNTGHIVKKYSNMNYIGANVGSLDASGMTTFHVDIWTPNANQFGIKLVTSTGEAQYNITPSSAIVTGSNWVSIDVPLSQFLAITPGMSLNHITDFLWADNMGGGVQNGTFYVDNIYFWTTNGVKSSISLGKQISWTNASGNTYQPQKSTDNSTWINLGSTVTNAAVTNVYDGSPVPFYRVQEINPGAIESVVNGGFETDDGGGNAANWTFVTGDHPARINTDAHSGTWCMDFNLPTPGGAVFIQQEFLPVTGGATYTFSAWSKLIQTGNISFGRFCLIQWFNTGTGFISQNQVNLTGPIGTWTQSTASLTAPANADQVQVQVGANLGAVSGDFGQVYIDDVSLSTGGTPSTNNIPASVQAGAGVTWKSGVGRTYTVQSRPDLSSGAWSNLGANVIGTGTNTVSDQATSSKNFYRVLEDY